MIDHNPVPPPVACSVAGPGVTSRLASLPARVRAQLPAMAEVGTFFERTDSHGPAPASFARFTCGYRVRGRWVIEHEQGGIWYRRVRWHEPVAPASRGAGS